MTMVEVYHFPGRGASVDDLLADGIKSARQLIKEGKIEDYSGSCMQPDHLDNIYFQWIPSKDDFPTGWIFDWIRDEMEKRGYLSIGVNPETTFVYNREFRAKGNPAKYSSSRMTLSNFIKKIEVARELLKENDSSNVFLDPISAQPRIMPYDQQVRSFAELTSFKKGYDPVNASSWQYLNEILVPKSVIPVAELAGYHKAQRD